MSISTTVNLCEPGRVKAARQVAPAWLVGVMVAVAGFSAIAETTNDARVSNASAPTHASEAQAEPGAPPAEAPPSRAASTSPKMDESAFNLIVERNIFNANRVGTVRLSSRRPARVETFTLVGTMAYEKGAFAFFDGSSSEFTKVIKAHSTIAGYKLADIFANSVKLEADGKLIDLPIGSQMRREDAGTWLMVAAPRSEDSSARSNRREDSGSRSNRNGDASRSRRGGDPTSSRSPTSEPAGKASATAAPAAAEQSEILKRLMERREKE
jgi:hypothetical protein